MKNMMTAAAIMLTSAGAFALPAAEEQLEVCVTTGACALMVHANEIPGSVYLVRSEAEYTELSEYWEGARFVPVTDEEYTAVRATLPSRSMLLPAVNPNDSWRAAAAARGNPAPKPSGSGPLVSGSVTVGNITIGGGGGNCADCHKGNWAEIHADVMKPKPKTGDK